MSSLQTRALILRHTPEREHDRGLVVLTPEHGQMRLKARGTKRSVSKLGGSLEPLMEVDLMLANGRAVDVVTGSVIVQRFELLRTDILRFTVGQWMLELVERITKPNHDSRELYHLTIRALHDLEQPKLTPGQLWLRLCRWAWQLLQHEGFVSPDIQSMAAKDVPLHPEALAFLQTGDWPKDLRASFMDVHGLVERVIHLTLDQPLRSEQVLQRVMRLEQLSERQRRATLSV